MKLENKSRLEGIMLKQAHLLFSIDKLGKQVMEIGDEIIEIIQSESQND